MQFEEHYILSSLSACFRNLLSQEKPPCRKDDTKAGNNFLSSQHAIASPPKRVQHFSLMSSYISRGFQLDREQLLQCILLTNSPNNANVIKPSLTLCIHIYIIIQLQLTFQIQKSISYIFFSFILSKMSYLSESCSLNRT